MRKTENHLEKHHRAHELAPVGRYSYRGVDYAVSLGGPFQINYPTTQTEREIQKDHPHGYYEYAWAIFRDDRPWIGGSNIIDKNHDLDKGYDEHGRERMRINAARKEAEWAIDSGAKAVLERDR